MSASEEVGYVKAWGPDWDAVCTASRCGWTIRTETHPEAADYLRLHAAMCHPPRIPVHR